MVDLQGQYERIKNDVIEFYKKLAGFRRSLAEKGITRESVRKNAMLLKSIFKDDRDNANR